MKYQALMMACTLLVTVFGNVVFYNKFKRHFEYFPQMGDDMAAVEEEIDESPYKAPRSNLLYFHPCYSYEKPTIWLPKDSSGLAEKLLEYLSPHTGALAGGSTDGALLVEEGINVSFKLLKEPPAK